MAKVSARERQGRLVKEPARLQESNSWLTEASASSRPIAWRTPLWRSAFCLIAVPFAAQDARNDIVSRVR